MSERPAQDPELPCLKDPAHLEDFRAAVAILARDDAAGWEKLVFVQTLPRLKTEGTFDQEPVRTMTVPIDRTRGELAMLQRDCLTFKER